MSRFDDKLNTYSFGQVEIEGVETRDEIRFNVKHVLIAIGAVTALVVALAVAVGVAYTVYAKKSMPLNPIVSRTFDSNVTVYYAASLNDIMTRVINPEFQSNYNIRVKTVSDASGNLAKFLKAGNVADVFISADSKISASLLPVLLPSKNVPVISWYTLWASTSLGIGYNKQSQFAPIFDSIANGSIPWYKGLNPDTMKIGRTDPDLDPKGYRTVIMAHLTDIYYNTSGTLKTIFRQARNSQQIYTEAKLEYALENESVDVGFFYKCEQLWTSGNLRFIPLPAKLDMSDKDLNSYYSKANYTNSVTKVTTVGSAVIYSVTIPNTSTNKDAAVKYILNMRSRKGLHYVLEEGINQLKETSFYGNLSTIPQMIFSQNITAE